MAIKINYDDFIVNEELSASWNEKISSSPNTYAFFKLHKNGLSTPEAASAVGRRMKFQRGSISYAGLKDKHAKTTQHITVKLNPKKKTPTFPQKIDGKNWNLKFLGFVADPIQAEAIASNQFELVIRNLTDESCADMDEAVSLFKSASSKSGTSLWIANYFGDQRFGSARHQKGFLAKLLIKGEFEEALRLAIATPARKDRRDIKTFKKAVSAEWGQWKNLKDRFSKAKFPELKALDRLVHSSGDFRAAFCALPYFYQQLCVYAYQSYLWNESACEVIAQQCKNPGEILDVPSRYGRMLFPAKKALPASFLELDLPLLAKKTTLESPLKEAVNTVLEREEIELEKLRIPGVRRPFFGQAPRKLIIEASEFELSKPVSSEEELSDRKAKRFRRKISFRLPRGAYATVVLRALGQ